jgi:hypothetical protein
LFPQQTYKHCKKTGLDILHGKALAYHGQGPGVDLQHHKKKKKKKTKRKLIKSKEISTVLFEPPFWTKYCEKENHTYVNHPNKYGQ